MLFDDVLDGGASFRSSAVRRRAMSAGAAHAEIAAKIGRAGYPVTSVHVGTVRESVMKLLLSNNNLASHVILGDRVGIRHDGRKGLGCGTRSARQSGRRASG